MLANNQCLVPDQGSLLLARFEKIGRSFTDNIEVLLEVSGTSREPVPDLRLGKLLVEFGFVTAEAVEFGIETARRLGIPMGKALLSSGWLTARHLQMGVQLQALLRDGLLSLPAALRVAEIVLSTNFTLEEALTTAGCAGAYEALQSKGTRIGDLLTESGLVNPEDMAEALRKSQLLNLPLGRCLLLSGLVGSALLETAVNAQRFLRAGKLSREDAIMAVTRAWEREQKRSGEETKVYPSVSSIKLGELLSASHIISEPQLEYAIEVGLRSGLPIGQSLTELGLISEEILAAALAVQSMVIEGELDPLGAAYALIDLHFHGKDLLEVISTSYENRRGKIEIDFGEFAAVAGSASQAEIDAGLEAASKSPYFLGKAMVFAGLIDETEAQSMICCYFYFSEGMLTLEESLAVLKTARSGGLSVDESMKSLGIALSIKDPV
ncbi:MAG: hypothetical protein AB7W16_16810 [Candidatus Obscuribacterales bacterium]